jgi:hypothetical protein
LSQSKERKKRRREERGETSKKEIENGRKGNEAKYG